MKSDSGNNVNRQKADALNKIPIFLAKTYRIVDNEEYKDIVSWTPDGQSFIVKNINRLTTEVFPQHFKHNNFLSFIRQLNMYGFHKLVTNNQSQGCIFHHDNFKRDQLDKLQLIKRKNTAQDNQNQQQLAIISNRQEKLQKEVALLRNQHEELQTMMEVLMEQNKTITAQNKAFIGVMSEMREKYRKKIETLMLLFLFGKKHKPDGDFLFPPQFNNVIEAFQEMNSNNNNSLHMLPHKKRKNQLMITQGEQPHFFSDGEKSQPGSFLDKEESEDIFKVLEPMKLKKSVSEREKHKDQEQQKIQKDHEESPMFLQWKNGIPISPLSAHSRPERKPITSDWDDYLERMSHSDIFELESKQQ